MVNRRKFGDDRIVVLNIEIEYKFKIREKNLIGNFILVVICLIIYVYIYYVYSILLLVVY